MRYLHYAATITATMINVLFMHHSHFMLHKIVFLFVSYQMLILTPTVPNIIKWLSTIHALFIFLLYGIEVKFWHIFLLWIEKTHFMHIHHFIHWNLWHLITKWNNLFSLTRFSHMGITIGFSYRNCFSSSYY